MRYLSYFLSYYVSEVVINNKLPGIDDLGLKIETISALGEEKFKTRVVYSAGERYDIFLEGEDMGSKEGAVGKFVERLEREARRYLKLMVVVGSSVAR